MGCFHAGMGRPNFYHSHPRHVSSLTVFVMAALTALALFFARSAHGEKSISRDEFLTKIHDNEVRAFVEENFRLAEAGRATRAGRHLPNAGERIPPYEIEAYPPGSTRPVIVRISENAIAIEVIACQASHHYSDCETTLAAVEPL